MGKIHLATDGQRLMKVEAPKIASGDKNVDFLLVDFCPLWDGFTKTAVFYRNENEIYYAVLNNENECVIPWEVLQTDGVLYMGIFGEKDDARKTSELITYKIDKGAIFDNTVPSDPTPNVYDQIIALYTAHTNNKSNPHEVTKDQVGLGNVPNVATDDQTPTFTVASTLANMVSGEKLSVAFGKIAKAVADFISHIGNKSNPHSVTIEQIGAAPAGYGLGAFSNIPHLADIDNPTGNGWFFYQVGNIYACVCVEGYASSYMIETMYDFYNGDPIITRRANFGYGWRAWEYVNPPMSVGVEYRTTERYEGKAVYKKLVTAQLADNTIIYVHLTDANGSLVSPRNVVDVDIRLTHANPSDSAFYSDGFKDLKNAYMYVTSLELHTTEGYSNRTAYVTFKYVKD